MGETHPRLLAVILEDLQEELTRWATVARDMIATATYTQKHAEERVDQAQRHAHIVHDQTVKDREAVNTMQERIEILLSACWEAKAQSHATLVEINIALKKAQTTLAFWSTELAEALTWLARAQARVRRAESEFAVAQAELSSAQATLAAAESALSSCESSYTVDQDGVRHYRNCSGERARVASARADVSAAQTRMWNAKSELQDAQTELARAHARVQCCRNAVQHATNATAIAQRAVEQAAMAVNAAERSLEVAQTAERFVTQATQKVTEEEQEADHMLHDVQLAANFTSAGQLHFHNAARAEESAQCLRISASTDLESRIGLLYELNKPGELL